MVPTFAEASAWQAGMVELADTLALGASAARHAGSSPVPGTILPLFLDGARQIEILNNGSRPNDNLNFRSLPSPSHKTGSPAHPDFAK
jgi:hypothetical protein